MHCKLESVQDFFCQNYEQRRQKLGTILGDKVSKKIENFNFYYESTNLEMFEEVVHNFGKSDDDMI